jgi:transmembrane sensor
MNITSDERLRDAVLDQATDWFTRHRADGELSAAEHAAFMDWLRRSPLHVQEYLALQQLAGDLPATLAGIGAESGPTSGEATGLPDNVVPFNGARAPEFGRRRKGLRLDVRVPLALVAALIIGLVVYPLATRPGLWLWPYVIAVPHGEQRTVQLPDGSVMHLNASSRVTVRYRRSERLIELEQGQALFEVADDRRRPFRVRTDNAQVVAVGTQFDVYRRSQDRTTVTVIQGKVEVKSTPSAGTADPHRVAERTVPLQVSAGEQVQLVPAMIPRVEPVDVHLATAWVHREIAFDRRPLGEIAEEINRYAPVPIDIEDESLRELRVSGVLDAYDTESMLLFLSQYGEAEVGKDAILIRSRARAPAPPSITAGK